MSNNSAPSYLFSGIRFNERSFEPSRSDIERICRFFSLGKLKHHQKEKGISVYHGNPLVFVGTSLGEFVLKFYSTVRAPKIEAEYTLNTILLKHRFPTPAMHAGYNGQPFFSTNDKLATCFSYIDGLPLWEKLSDKHTIRQVNTILFLLKNILSIAHRKIFLEKQPALAATLNAMAKNSRAMAPYNRKETIDETLLEAGRVYQSHQSLFARQRLYNNANFGNFLIKDKTTYLLDLEHIQEDYVLTDLACLVISYIYLNAPIALIKTVTKDYFARHKIKSNYLPVLNTLIKIRLIKRYLENIHREKSRNPFDCSPNLMHSYRSHLTSGQKLIASALRWVRSEKLSKLF